MIGELFIVGLVIAIVAGSRKPTKTTRQYRDGTTEVDFHNSGKTVKYRNGRRVK
jgi:hypothetical protein